jgi:4-amino-4-deoxy-L-arabinose transferase-like glycosyltransferase
LSQGKGFLPKVKQLLFAIESSFMESRSNTSRPILFAALFFLVGAVFRFYALDHQSIWNDELFSLNVAKLPLTRIPGELRQSYFHPPLYFALLHFVVRWLGTSEWALRLLSALFGSLTVGAVFLVTRKLFNEQSAMWASLFCLIDPFPIAYSQEARPYALAGFLCVVSTAALYQAWVRKLPRYYIVYILVTVAALYTHHWVVLFVIAQILFVIADGVLHRESLKLPAFSYLGVAVLYVPLVATVLHQTARVNASPWFWSEPASLNHLVWTAIAFGGGYFKIASGVFDSPLGVKVLLSIISLGLFGLSVWAARKKDIRASHMVLVSLFGTLAIAFAVSMFRPEAYLWYRYPVIVFPLYCITLGVGVKVIRKTHLQFALAVVFVLFLALGMYRYYHWEKANAKSVATFVEGVASERTDIIIRPVYFAELFNYYYRGSARQVNEGPFESAIAPALQNVNRFVVITLDIPNEVRDLIDSHFEKILERDFPGEANMGILVGVYRRKASPQTMLEFKCPTTTNKIHEGGDS